MLKRLLLSYGLIILAYVACLVIVGYISENDVSTRLNFITTCFFILSFIFVTVDNLWGGKDKFFVGFGSTVILFLLRLLLILGIVLYFRNNDLTLGKTSILYVVFAMILFMIIEKYIALNEKVFGRN